MTSTPSVDIGIPPWETYIASSTNPCMVGQGKTTGVLLKPYFWHLYHCRNPFDLTDGMYVFQGGIPISTEGVLVISGYVPGA